MTLGKLTYADKVRNPQHFWSSPAEIQQTSGFESRLIRKSGLKSLIPLVKILVLVEVCAM